MLYTNSMPDFHYVPAEQKLQKQWLKQASDYWCMGGRMRGLLEGKNVREIKEYSSGRFSLQFVRNLFKSLRKQAAKASNSNNQPFGVNGATNIVDPTGISWECVPFIEKRLTPAIAAMEKIPFEFRPKCMDATAAKRKKEDLDFLRAKPEIEAELQPLADSLNLGKVDVGTTKYSSIPFGGLPLGLDIYDESEFALFAEMVYNYAPENAFKMLLKVLYDMKRVDQVRSLEIKDQFLYAVNCSRTIVDGVTGMPDVKYVFPGDVWTDTCVMPDYSDRNVTRTHEYVTPNELLNMFGSEINGLEHLKQIVNNKSMDKNGVDSGYIQCNSPAIGTWSEKEFATEKMVLYYWEIKSPDYINVALKDGKYGKWEYYTKDESKAVRKQWAQNTYCFYQLRNTSHFFGIQRLPYAYRSRGNESYSNFSINIYKSKERSAVELAIGENKKAQIAEIKLQNHIIKALGPGFWLDVKGVRDFVASQSDTPDKMSYEDAMTKMIETNHVLIDSSGFEGRMNGQYVPFREIPGGLKDEVLGYAKVLDMCDANIAAYMGVNDQLAGQAISQDSLVGLQKIMLNQSLNGLNYVQKAIKSNYQYVFNAWVSAIQRIIEEKGSEYKAIVNLIGTAKADVIDAMDAIPIHQIGLVVDMGSTVEQKEYFKMGVQQAKQKGIISSMEERYILGIEDYQEASMVLGVLEHKFKKEQQAAQQRQLDGMLQQKQQEGQNILQNTQMASQLRMQENEAAAQQQAMILQLSEKLKLSSDYQRHLLKKQLQDGRINQTAQNRTDQMVKKQELERQQSLVA